MAVYDKLLLFALLLLCSECSAGDKALPGHMQPLGSHMEPELVRRIDHMPSPSEFYENFVRPKIPVVLEGLMSGQEVLRNWQSDDYLRYTQDKSYTSSDRMTFSTTWFQFQYQRVMDESDNVVRTDVCTASPR